MEQKFELTESEELGYYTTFDKLFPAFLYQDNSEKDRTIQLNFQFTDEDTQPNEAQIAAHDYLLTHSNQMLENLVKYLKQDEEYFMEYYGVYKEISFDYTFNGKNKSRTSKHGFPAVEKFKDYINYIEISGINISSSDEDGIAYIGFTGGCSWEEEHGLRVAFHKQKLLHVGAWDYGYHPSWGSREHNDLLTNSFLNSFKLEHLDKRRKRLSTASELIQVENTEDYDQIFNWLIKHQMIYGYRNSPVDLTSKEKIVVLKEIKKLSLSGQNIQNIPDSLHLLENLISLEFWVNNLGIIPPQIFKLLKLENLSINNNQIKHVPEEIGLLKNLRSLNLRNNKLNSIPEHIAQLEKLEHLDLSGNQLSDLTVSILSLDRLKALNLMNNNLSEIHESIYELKKLERLDLRYNKLSKFPETIIDKWHSLKFIFLVGNQFSINALERIIRFNNRTINSDIEKELSFTKDKLFRELREEKSKLEQEKIEARKQDSKNNINNVHKEGQSLDLNYQQNKKDKFNFLIDIPERDLENNYSKKELKTLFFIILKHFQDFKINLLVINPNPEEIVYDENNDNITSIPIQNLSRLKRVIEKDRKLVQSICKYFPRKNDDFFRKIVAYSRRKFDNKLYNQILDVQSKIKIPVEFLKIPQKKWWEFWK